MRGGLILNLYLQQSPGPALVREEEKENASPQPLFPLAARPVWQSDEEVTQGSQATAAPTARPAR
jgi:hypothetical protein